MHRNPLPQLDRLFLTDAGLESDMIFNRGFDLPCFSSLMLLSSDTGRHALRAYFKDFLVLARSHGTGCLLETATWRASPDWAPPLGLSLRQLEEMSREAVGMVAALRSDYPDVDLVVSGCLGPRGDGYDPGKVMTDSEAFDYHQWQARVLASAGADMLSAITMTNVNEAIGIARAARDTDLPVAISFTVETDGRLPTDDALSDAIEAVDSATNGYPAYFMINCAHPTHFAETLLAGGDWARRVRGLRANASRCSHAELDVMTELDDGDPQDLGVRYKALVDSMPWLSVLGGCCGTDIRHLAAIADSCSNASQSSASGLAERQIA